MELDLLPLNPAAHRMAADIVSCLSLGRSPRFVAPAHLGGGEDHEPAAAPDSSEGQEGN
ncbi:hypothetical protein AS9A_1197 [Hoyosella subflava DQS3-9A1]|uniref:Uncharacterized protein n=1 Tax=Hoyosella subflava (strain DSM 45089 / JCM 17490 / NBRC 109087 / DQS3-9A1) TaxID=443218 RepID=F6ERS2_HOYSD|nr:hypothetical protein AS9A_1197 [Hoyosella subflava DQS3-9A1]